jgi:hypothetical protein
MRIHSLILVLVVDFVCADGLNPQSAPKANEVITPERPYRIQWSPGTDGPVKIELHDGDNSCINITGAFCPHNSHALDVKLTIMIESTENDGSFD